MSAMRHWIARPPAGTPSTEAVFYDETQRSAWLDAGWAVAGPFVLESSEAAVEAFVRYGQHTPGCAVERHSPLCTCGYVETLAGIDVGTQEGTG